MRVFERNLNDPDNRINNLDLNGDNLVDYIMVSDNVNGNIHYIVLRVAINRKESQDVAVFTVQRFDNGQIYVQLTGDESLYGKNYIIEPAQQVLLADWPLVSNIYRTNYITWHSDWYWGYYPDYWTPWSPFYWHYYYGYNYYWNDYYYTCYHRSYAHNDMYWNDHYYNRYRVYSQEVNHNVHSGYYSNTYSHPEKIKEGEEQYKNRRPEEGRRSTYSTYSGSIVNRQGSTTNTTARRISDLSARGSVREERPVQYNTREVGTVRSATREERPVQKDTREVRAVQSVVREERTAPASHKSEGEERQVKNTSETSKKIESAGSSRRR